MYAPLAVTTPLSESLYTPVFWLTVNLRRYTRNHIHAHGYTNNSNSQNQEPPEVQMVAKIAERSEVSPEVDATPS